MLLGSAMNLTLQAAQLSPTAETVVGGIGLVWMIFVLILAVSWLILPWILIYQLRLLRYEVEKMRAEVTPIAQQIKANTALRR